MSDVCFSLHQKLSGHWDADITVVPASETNDVLGNETDKVSIV